MNPAPAVMYEKVGGVGVLVRYEQLNQWCVREHLQITSFGDTGFPTWRTRTGENTGAIRIFAAGTPSPGEITRSRAPFSAWRRISAHHFCRDCPADGRIPTLHSLVELLVRSGLNTRYSPCN